MSWELARWPGFLEQREQRQQQKDDDDPEGEISQIGVHPNLSFLPRACGGRHGGCAFSAMTHNSHDVYNVGLDAICQGKREKAPRIRPF